MKKFLSILICLSLLFLLVGCGNAGESPEGSPASDDLKPQLSVQELYSAYSKKVDEYETTYGKLTKPTIAPGSDGYSDMLNGVAYIDLIDFNRDDTEELVLVYFKPYGEDNPSPYLDTVYDGCMFMTVFAAQGKDIVRVFEYKLPASEYRCLSSCTVQYGLVNDNICIFNCMDYYLHMPEVEPHEYQSVEDYNQWFTADCYYGYDGAKFQMVYKDTWQGEGMHQILMYNDEIYTYNSDEKTESPVPRVYDFETILTVSNYDECSEKVAKVKGVLSSEKTEEHISFDEQSKYSSHRDIADYLLLSYTNGSVRDNNGIYEITDNNIVEKDGVVSFTITYTYFDEAYKECSDYEEKVSEKAKILVDLSTGFVYSYRFNFFLDSEYLW